MSLREDGWGGRRNELAEHWDWGPLYGCFEVNGKNSISPSDLDFCVERNGRFLVFETKQPGEKLSVGQAIMLGALARTYPLFVVFIVTGRRNDPTRWERVLPSSRRLALNYGPVQVGGWPALRSLAARWFRWADSQKEAA